MNDRIVSFNMALTKGKGVVEPRFTNMDLLFAPNLIDEQLKWVKKMEETIRTNALIAGFMVPDQWQNIRDHSKVVFKQPIDNQCTWYLEELLYHKSWDWLMPVVDKIGEMGFNFGITRSWVTIQVTADSDGFFEEAISHSNRTRPISKIEATLMVAVKFIEWYNK